MPVSMVIPVDTGFFVRSKRVAGLFN
jgi:hypothetical protein